MPDGLEVLSFSHAHAGFSSDGASVLAYANINGNWRNVSWDIETREFNGDGSLNGGYASTTTSGDGRFEIKFGEFGNVDSNSYVELSKVPFDAASLAIKKIILI